MVYGYCSITLRQGSYEAQENKIKELRPDAVIIKDDLSKASNIGYTKGINLLLTSVKPGDYVIMEGPEKLGKNTINAYNVFLKLHQVGALLYFYNVQHLSTDTITKVYNNLMRNARDRSGKFKLYDFIQTVYKDQIVDYLDYFYKERENRKKRRTQTNIEKGHGKSGKGTTGLTYLSSNFYRYKDMIINESKSFNGTLSDQELLEKTGLSRNSYYKYKKAIKAELDNLASESEADSE